MRGWDACSHMSIFDSKRFSLQIFGCMHDGGHKCLPTCEFDFHFGIRKHLVRSSKMTQYTVKYFFYEKQTLSGEDT